MTFPTVSVGDVEQYIEEGRDMVLVDVRNRASYQLCHLRGAVNIPYQMLQRGEFQLPSDKTVVIYCARGGQSLMACRLLNRLGYHVVNVANGIEYYRGKYLVRNQNCIDRCDTEDLK